MLISIEFSGADFIGQKVGYVASIFRFIGQNYYSFVDVLRKQWMNIREQFIERPTNLTLDN